MYIYFSRRVDMGCASRRVMCCSELQSVAVSRAHTYTHKCILIYTLLCVYFSRRVSMVGAPVRARVRDDVTGRTSEGAVRGLLHARAQVSVCIYLCVYL